MNKLFTFIVLWMMSCLPTFAQAPMDGGVWEDNTGKHINAHGGNIFNYKGTYYWYGESRSQDGKPYSSLGVSCFTSKDLKKWTNHGLVLPVSNEAGSDIEGGCIIERPKVLYNKKTKKFVMWFHLELKGRGYGAARYGVATSDTPFGPFKFIRSGRVNPGLYPIYVRVAAGGQNEAPTIFKQDGIYWMITSGCTGWAPNAARMFKAKNIYGPWEQLPNPCRGEGADKTFGAQGTFIYKVETAAQKKMFHGADYVFMADMWNPKHLSDSRHLWVPISWENGAPVLKKQ